MMSSLVTAWRTGICWPIDAVVFVVGEDASGCSMRFDEGDRRVTNVSGMTAQVRGDAASFHQSQAVAHTDPSAARQLVHRQAALTRRLHVRDANDTGAAGDERTGVIERQHRARGRCVLRTSLVQ